MVVMDAGTLLLLFRPDVDAPIDSATGKPIEAVQQRISFLVKTLEKSKTKIVIPTPALSELLVRAGNAGPALVQQIEKMAVFRIIPFDTLAAIEAAAMTHAAIQTGDKRGGLISAWAKVKFDRQIVAIARVAQAATIYSDDEDVEKLGRVAGIHVVKIASLPLPPSDAQGNLPLETPIEASGEADSQKEPSDEELEKIFNESATETEEPGSEPSS